MEEYVSVNNLEEGSVVAALEELITQVKNQGGEPVEIQMTKYAYDRLKEEAADHLREFNYKYSHVPPSYKGITIKIVESIYDS